MEGARYNASRRKEPMKVMRGSWLASASSDLDKKSAKAADGNKETPNELTAVEVINAVDLEDGDTTEEEEGSKEVVVSCVVQEDHELGEGGSVGFSDEEEEEDEDEEDYWSDSQSTSNCSESDHTNTTNSNSSSFSALYNENENSSVREHPVVRRARRDSLKESFMVYLNFAQAEPKVEAVDEASTTAHEQNGTDDGTMGTPPNGDSATGIGLVKSPSSDERCEGVNGSQSKNHHESGDDDDEDNGTLQQKQKRAANNLMDLAEFLDSMADENEKNKQAGQASYEAFLKEQKDAERMARDKRKKKKSGAVDENQPKLKLKRRLSKRMGSLTFLGRGKKNNSSESDESLPSSVSQDLGIEKKEGEKLDDRSASVPSLVSSESPPHTPKANTKSEKKEKEKKVKGKKLKLVSKQNSQTEAVNTSRYLSNDGEELHINNGDGRVIVVGGTMRKLVAKLADTNDPDTEYLNIFMLTFRHIVTPQRLLSMLIDHFDDSSPNESSSGQHVAAYGVIQLRTVNFIVKWIKGPWGLDFYQDETMSSLVNTLKEKMKLRGCDSLVVRLENTLDEQMKMQEMETSSGAGSSMTDISATGSRSDLSSSNCSSIQNSPRISRQLDSGNAYRRKASLSSITVMASKSMTADEKKMRFLDMDPTDVAYQLALIDQAMFKAIKPHEFVVELCYPSPPEGSKWQRARSNLGNYVEWFNKVSYWVATEICLTADLKKRISVIERFIKIAKTCKRLNNFNTLYAVVSGLNHGSVARMKKTVSHISNKSITLLKDLEDFLNPLHNFENYRLALRNLTKAAPVVPIMVVILKDLTFINEMPRTLNNGFANFFKLRTLASKLYVFENWQERPNYTFKPEKAISSYCKNLPVASEKAIYHHSCMCEPKDDSLAERIKLIENWESSEQSAPA
eukprot:Nk52_evm31s296 gene=Nk52_evmTU31s296